jgi:toxin ParE1/3/4
MPTLLVHDRARQDVVDIFHHIAPENLAAALRVYDAIEATFHLVASHPGAGPVCRLPDPALADLRFLPVREYRGYLVIYRALQDGAEIVRVIHGARNLASALRGSP